MKNKIGFIAVGQAAGNVGLILEQKGYKVLYINTSQEDLDTLSNAKFKHHIKDGEGCNKDRLKAKQALMDDFESISRKISEGLGACEFVYVIFSSGGGTGSGAGPMLADLILGDMEEGLLQIQNVGIITILPALDEPIKANINSYECFSELSQIDGLASSIILDNSFGDKIVINQKFVKTFTSFLEIPDKHKSERGNIDKAEIMETIKATGMMQIIQIPAKESKTDVLLEKLNKGFYPAPEGDGILRYLTISQAGVSINLGIVQMNVGTPLDIFQTYNEHSTIIGLSGLTYPATRLNQTYEKIEESRERVLHSLQANTQIELKEGINFLQETVRSKPVRERRRMVEDNNTPKSSGTSRRDIMKKYMKG